MSRIATMILAATAGTAAGEGAVTAFEALARSRAVTSIGPDPCRRPTGDEIVVCGRRESPYALPLYDPTDDDDASVAGGNRVGQMTAIKASESACAKQGNQCLPPPLFNLFSVLPVVVKGVKALIDDE